MSDKAGLWQDGELLVVDLQNADFGGRCPWTNEESARKESISVLGPRPAGWSISLRRGVRYEAKQELLRLQLPASDGWIAKRQILKRQVGNLVALMGLVATISMSLLLVIIYFYYPREFSIPHPNAFSNSVIALTIGLFLIGTGFAWPYIDGTPGPGGYLPAKLIDYPHVWIQGANSKFLASLPTWTGEPLKQRRIAGQTFAEAAGKNWPILLILPIIAAFVAILAMAK